MKAEVPVGRVVARAFTIPTDKPEADGTISWRATTLVLVEVSASSASSVELRSASPLADGDLVAEKRDN